MSYEVIGITVLWIFLFGYLIVASIDFGAGFFSYYSTLTGKRHLINNIIERYLSPVWEVTNVFLVFFFVGIVGFFPDTAYYYGTALLIPGSIAIILLAIRGSYYAFSTYGFKKDSRFYLFLYGASGLLIPAALSTVMTISEGGYIDVDDKGKVTFLFSKLFTSTYSWTVVLLAIVSVLYISAMFLTYYANRANDRGAFEVVRKYAIAWSGPTILSSLLVFFAIRGHNPVHFERMTSYAWMFVVSFACFLVAIFLVWTRKRLGLAFIFVMLQFGFAFFGYGAGHLPYVLYPYLTIHDNFTSEPMAIALISVFILGLLLLIPSLYLLMRLFLFDTKYVQGKRGK
ncbi:cytochrome D ubiquinol oxidase subunit II [Paenibacillus baekrokdamisoli]|uniref:Cytochrome D ubiquinol oxidase subunit II n=1 Tax=Paenibacillus baekrokdamisoli TaxID=1712516 RepID=A0A3G9IKC8_9BACL|nr:cytochrome d ubiquinol oxidase subunit II [Paenibacillus baekrokdamisoli]MBB3069281.1 cytochrome d ubiquinol oxidase subunit II [Paenibacillus baekrokdamisoli]BBH18746.1 cytochrome D ubiquinol oxidase subunit II [Paenibacillus baekrokdamisoli]